MNYRTLDNMKTAFIRETSEYSAMLEGWEKVKFPTKKDGSPFSVLSKNIEGAKIYRQSYAMQAGEDEISVTVWGNEIGYVTDKFMIYSLVEDMKKDDKRLLKTQNFMPKETYLKQVYKFDLEDIKEAISNRIEYLKKLINRRKRQLEIMENAYKTFRNAYGKAIEELKANSESEQDIHLFYAIEQTIKESFPYC